MSFLSVDLGTNSISPSNELTISNTVTLCGVLASSYPPFLPRVLLITPALPSRLKICSRYWCGMLQREEISFICRSPEPYDSARVNSAAMPYLVFLLIVNMESFLAVTGGRF